jgi:hypothetical protein
MLAIGPQIRRAEEVRKMDLEDPEIPGGDFLIVSNKKR